MGDLTRISGATFSVPAHGRVGACWAGRVRLDAPTDTPCLLLRVVVPALNCASNAVLERDHYTISIGITMSDKAELPSTNELVEPIRKLLEYLNSCDDWDEIPQIAALREIFMEPSVWPAGRELAYVLYKAIDEQYHGPFPRYPAKPHPNAGYWNELIRDISNVATKPMREDSCARYDQARQALNGDRDIAARVPATVRASKSLAAFRALVDDAARDAQDVDAAKQSFIINEFRPLTSWLDGRPLYGSAEWIAQEAWYVKTSIDIAFATMHRVVRLREVIKGQGVHEVMENRWRRFIERELHGSRTVGAMEVAWASMLVTAQEIAMIQKTQVPPIDEDRVVGGRRKRRGRGPRHGA